MAGRDACPRDGHSRFAGAMPSADLLERVRGGEVGGVILFGENIRSPAAVATLVRKLQQVASAGGNPPLLVAVDQEGGQVRRLPDGPPSASAARLGQTLDAAGVAAEGRRTGAYLHRLGLSVDLAPVADVADARTSFLGSRVFGNDPDLVARLAPAFAGGLQRAHVAATAKHFPGLGTAPANTDVARVVVRTRRGELQRRLRPFRAAVASGVKLVMVSNASYPALDATGAPALFSRPIVGNLLRGRLGFGGVVITDALGAPAPRATAHAPARALAAGVDVLLYTSEAESRAGFADLLASARSSAAVRSHLAAADARIAALKAWLAHG